MSLLAESEALHARVRAFAQGGSAAAFEELALAIADYQRRWHPGFARLVERRGGALSSAAAIPAVPVEAFRLTRVAVHPRELDEVRFETSGTTGGVRGTHAMRTTQTYRELSLRWGKRALMAADRATVIALASRPDTPCTSSLGFMMRAMITEFDGRDLESDDTSDFDAEKSERWLLVERGVDVHGVERAAAAARRRAEPLLVLATSFALVALLDSLGGARFETPDGTVVMQTGGFKGRSREVEPAALRRDVARAFRTSEALVIGEYGMTELTSQLYDGSANGLPGAEPGAYVPPPWLSVDAVDPVTLEPLEAGQVGLARFVDLGNVDSAVAIVTQDLVCRNGRAVELRGRSPAAPPRGCSLAIEELLFDPGVIR